MTRIWMLVATMAVAGAAGAWAAAIPWTPPTAAENAPTPPTPAPPSTTPQGPQGAPAPGPQGPGDAADAPNDGADLRPRLPEYEARQSACPQNQPCKEDSLVLPLARAAEVYGPRKAAGGQMPLGDIGPLRADIIWQIVAWRTEHEEFLARLEAAGKDEEKFALADWCAEKGLAACREWILRNFLREHWFGTEHPSYKKALELWLPAATKYTSPYVFDLPVRGEWYVLRDEGGLNRRKHGAAFARNLAIVRGGRETDGTGTALKNYYAWNQPFYAIAEGRITKVDDRHPDPPLGRGVGVEDGNYITQDCGGGVYAFYGHIKSGSAAVKEGQRAPRGTELGRVGNSGGNGKPHLHFILMDADHFSIAGRYRFEQVAGNRWAPRDGVDMAEDTYIRPAPEKSPSAAPAKPAPVRKAR